MPRVHVAVRSPRADRLWLAARMTALAALVGAFAILWFLPATGLAVVWGGVVPAIATSLFVSPTFWRGVCPLATLNEAGNRIGRPAIPSPAVQTGLGVAGLVLFHTLVPARLLLFNHNGASVVIAGLGIGVLAIGLGARFAVRSAFCNALCPILPVERLYGQAPLLAVERGRCSACTVCTPRGCLDLSGTKNVAQVVGRTRRSAAWLLTPFGIFAAALPGFIYGYFQAPTGLGTPPLDVYRWTLGLSAASYLLVALLVLVSRLRSGVVLPLIAAAAGMIYFGYSGPAIARLWHAPAPFGIVLGSGGVVFVALWLVRALRTPKDAEAWLPPSFAG